MSLDPILRILQCDFPILPRAAQRYLNWCSWIGQLVPPVCAGAYALREGDKEGFVSLAGALIINQFFLEVMKRLIISERPNGHPGSFPSGHTSAAFLGAAFLGFRYGFNTPFVIVGLTACAVGLSRVVLQAHWVHDVVAGAFMGVAIAYLFANNSGKPSK
jgi:membrane-associated phospholipid phosphatase